MNKTRAVICFFVAAFMLFAGRSFAADVTFEGQTIRMIIGLKAGGGTDLQARLVGPFLSKYLPGNPKMLYVNMPGADGVQALNYGVLQTKPDGLTIMAASASNLNPSVLKAEQTKYNANTLSYVGGIAPAGTFLVIRKDAMERLHDRSKPPVVVADVDGFRSGVMMAAWGALYLDWNLRWVFGYPGTADLILAVQRGEADLTGTASITQINNLMQSDIAVPLAQIGVLGDGKITRRKSYPDVPLITELLEGHMDAEGLEAFRNWVPGNQIGKWFAMPPNVPPEILAVYRAAFDKVGEDPEFVKLAQQQIDPDFSMTSGVDLEEIARVLADSSPRSQAFMDGIYEKIANLRSGSGAKK
jgi:hypothetical protein